nr:MAG TPA: hypothetical protein [Caudoviricetes sp.]
MPCEEIVSLHALKGRRGAPAAAFEKEGAY